MVPAWRSCWLLTSASIPTPTQTIEVRMIRRVSLSKDSRPQGDYDTQNNNISDLQVTVSLVTLLSHFGTVFASVFISVVLVVLKDHRIVKSGAWYGGRASQCRHHLCIPFASLLGRAKAIFRFLMDCGSSQLLRLFGITLPGTSTQESFGAAVRESPFFSSSAAS